MALLEVKNLSFKYSEASKKTLENISFDVNEGEFVIISGASGCGKTTLLRLIKHVCSPNGEKDGDILFNGKEVSKLSVKENTEIGFVMQNPDNQMVTDTVWQELAFGLENLRLERSEIRKRIAEVCSFFGINSYYHKKVNELSGGEKQLLTVASILVMEPKIILFDEATSQLDPIATIDFINLLDRINKELGITIIMVSHNLDECFDKATRLIFMEDGKIVNDFKKEELKDNLSKLSEVSIKALPIFDRMFVTSNYLPNNINEARLYYANNFNNKLKDIEYKEYSNKNNIIEIKNAYFRYSKDDKDILKDLSLSVKEGEILTIFGANGSGKTTLIKVISGIRKLYSGKVLINHKNIKKLSDLELYHKNISVISQNPYSLFTCDSVYGELSDVCKIMDNKDRLEEVVNLLKIDNLLKTHPYDLSGGEAQKVALAKMLLFEPKIIILDEATKGLDVYYKEELANILLKLKEEGKTIILVTHDMEFASSISDRCALYFDGEIVSIEEKHKFLSHNRFFTTTTAKITKGYNNIVTLKEFIEALNG